MKKLYILFGFICMGVGSLGAILPVLPTVPFLLSASICFAKGSPKFDLWFRQTKLYQKHLEEFIQHKVMSLPKKIFLLSFSTIMIMIPLIIVDNLFARISLVLLEAIKYYYFMFIIETKGEETNAN